MQPLTERHLGPLGSLDFFLVFHACCSASACSCCWRYAAIASRRSSFQNSSRQTEPQNRCFASRGAKGSPHCSHRFSGILGTSPFSLCTPYIVSRIGTFINDFNDLSHGHEWG